MIINKILLFIYNSFFLLFKINDNQSLEYQIMVILMHLYKMRRFGLIDYCSYVGDSRLIITSKDFKRVDNMVYYFLTVCNQEILISTSQKPLSFFGALCHDKENVEYFKIYKKLNSEIFDNDDKGESIVFELTEKGHSYQYNGYKRSEVRLQDKANFFAMIAIFGASFSWLVDKEFIDYKSYLSLGKSFLIYLELSMFYFFRKKNLKKLFLMFIIFIIIDFIICYYFISRSANEVYYYKIYYHLY